MNNNNNNIETSIYIEVENRQEPYDTADDTFQVDDNFAVYGAGCPGAVNGVTEMFSRGPTTLPREEECPICMDNYTTSGANTSNTSFPDGFQDCPVKFECGFTCCFSCMCNYFENHSGIDGFVCYSCRQIHNYGLFLRLVDPPTVTPTTTTEEAELVQRLLEEAQLANQEKKILLRKLHLKENLVSTLMQENEQLTTQVRCLKRKLNSSSSKKKKNTNKKVKLDDDQQ